MATGVPHRRQRQAKLEPCFKFFCIPCFESLHWPCGAAKRRLICQTLWNKAVAWTPRRGKMAALSQRKNDIPHLCVPLLQGKLCVVVSSSFCPSMCKIGALDSSNNRNRCLEILDSAGTSSNCVPKDLLVHGDFPFFNVMFSRLSRIILDTITSCNCFQTQAELWGAKNWIFF